MSPLKSALAGLGVGLVAYFGAGGIGALLPDRGANIESLVGAEVSPSVAPGANEVPSRGTNSGTNATRGAKTVAPTLAPAGTSVAPTPAVSVTPRLSILPTPTVSPSVTVTPRPSVTPNPSNTPSPTPTPTPSPTSAVTATPTPTSTASVTPTPQVGTSKVVINEIAWMGTAADANDEWIELYNAGDGAADLTGWVLESADGAPKIPLSGTIGAGDYWLMERTSSSSVDLAEDFIYSGALGNTGEDLALRNAGGFEVDRVGPGAWYAGANPSGKPLERASMERIVAAKPGNDATNWATWGSTAKEGGFVTSTGKDADGNEIHGTPKYKNSVSP